RPDHQRLVDLRDIEGWSYEDIARFEGVTVESVRGSLRRARMALRHAYERLATAAPVVMFTTKLRNLHRRAENAALRFQAFAVPGVAAVARVVPGGPAGGTQHVAPVARIAPVAPSSPAPAAVTPAVTPSGAAPIAGHKPAAAPKAAGLLPVSPGVPVIAPGAPVTPESTTFEEVTPSPHYESDHTMFGV